ncbi:hypothetical protein JMJ55_06430 [Belnapia sp. T6]|uniref:Uncharacterized protein n=1 Tax=Belnapia mucosa TaxID=2804532 RepID=A0ABS1UZS1_9PROT|nr:hypothetical protein [Belnapia mucosa]MBL6454952.1 hypothetical protein [Belnapia mucosa]
MAQDSDVARVAAALKAPGIRYRSFGNDPVRGATPPADNAAGALPDHDRVPEDAAPPAPQPAAQAPQPVEPPAARAIPDRIVYAPPAMPEAPAPQPVAQPAYAVPPQLPPSPPAPSAFVAQHQTSPAPPSFTAQPYIPSAPPGYPPPQAYAAPAYPPAGPPPSFAPMQPAMPPPAPAPVPTPAPYRLLEALGRPDDVMPQGAALALGPMEGRRADGLLPAALVTLPLAEVLRLVAAGPPITAASPFAAFRIPGNSPSGR